MARDKYQCYKCEGGIPPRKKYTEPIDSTETQKISESLHTEYYTFTSVIFTPAGLAMRRKLSILRLLLIYSLAEEGWESRIARKEGTMTMRAEMGIRKQRTAARRRA
jgi:hypothetical protein